MGILFGLKGGLSSNSKLYVCRWVAQYGIINRLKVKEIVVY